MGDLPSDTLHLLGTGRAGDGLYGGNRAGRPFLTRHHRLFKAKLGDKQEKG